MVKADLDHSHLAFRPADSIRPTEAMLGFCAGVRLISHLRHVLPCVSRLWVLSLRLMGAEDWVKPLLPTGQQKAVATSLSLLNFVLLSGRQ